MSQRSGTTDRSGWLHTGQPVASSTHCSPCRKLVRAGEVQLAFCWAHVRRRFFELAAGGTSPIATDALARIAQLNTVEADLRG